MQLLETPKPPSMTLWTVRHHGNEVRCVVDAPAGTRSAFAGGTAKILVDGALTDVRTFGDVDELSELSAGWLCLVSSPTGDTRR